MTLRKTLFWIHLTAGSVAGIVILIMSATGVLLAYERQINVWVNREYRSTAPYPGAQQLPARTLIAKACATEPANPTNVVLHAESGLPMEVAFGPTRTVYFDTYTGNPIGLASQTTRNFFRRVEDWHRWLGASGKNRPLWRSVTGVCNAAFFVLVSTGLYLWWPKSWTWSRWKAAATWRWNPSTNHARNWNWHTVTGFWCAGPLLVIVLCGIVMSFPWANNLLYRMTGNNPPPAQGPAAPPTAAVNSVRTPPGGGRQNGGRSEATSATPQKTGEHGSGCGNWNTEQVNQLWARAEQQVPDWKSISFRPPASATGAAIFTIDQGDGGQPNKRAQLTLNWQTGETTRWEPFSSYNLGRRLRAWVRFSHTGEAGGLVGQTIAALVTLGTTVLVLTGLAMAWKRFVLRWVPVSGDLAREKSPRITGAKSRAEINLN